MKPADIESTPEPIWYFRSRKLYQGKFPSFYDMDDTACGKILLENYEAIRDELLTFWGEHASEVPAENIGWNYDDPGWRTMSLYAFGYKHRGVCEKLPFLTSVIEQIPLMVGTTVSVLLPHVRIHAHVGGTSAIIRTHLGIRIPGEPPEVAIRVGGHVHGWQDGAVFGIETARRHVAWNNTDLPRIAITVDTIKDEFAAHLDDVNGRAIGLMGMWRVATKFPITKRLPEPVLGLIHTSLAIGGAALIKTRRLLKMQPALPRSKRRPA